MKTHAIHCEHACRNTCAMLNKALGEETALVQLYKGVISECDHPEVRKLFIQLAEERSRTVLRLLQKLNEMRARAEALDGVEASFGE